MKELFCSLMILCWLSTICSHPKCIPGQPCIFMGKDIGQIGFVPSTTRQPHGVKSISWNNSETSVIVSISSYRDRLCPITLSNLFRKAAYPTRITAAVVQQNAQDDADCEEKYCEIMISKYLFTECPFRSNIRMMRVDATIAKGPIWARALGSKLIHNEEFCLQTDSHMDFVNNWDIKMLAMWASTNNEYAILSTYVSDSAELAKNLEENNPLNRLHEVPHLCMVTLHGAYGMVRNWGTKCMQSFTSPKLTNAMWGAGLSFSKCHAERKVPYDPHLPHIFDGEEFSRATRFWTWGYDMYTPHRTFIVHDYKNSQADHVRMGWTGHTTNESEGSVQSSVDRLKALLGMPGGSLSPSQVTAVQRSRYGLGDRRSLDQAIAFSGVDTKRMMITDNKCGNLDWVPFVEHPKGPEYIPQFNTETEFFEDEVDSGSVYHHDHELDYNHALKLDEHVVLGPHNHDSVEHTTRVAPALVKAPMAIVASVSKETEGRLDHSKFQYQYEFQRMTHNHHMSMWGVYLSVLCVVGATVTAGVVHIMYRHRWHSGKAPVTSSSSGSLLSISSVPRKCRVFEDETLSAVKIV